MPTHNVPGRFSSDHLAPADYAKLRRVTAILGLGATIKALRTSALTLDTALSNGALRPVTIRRLTEELQKFDLPSSSEEKIGATK
jgi:hypothetical protein